MKIKRVFIKIKIQRDEKNHSINIHVLFARSKAGLQLGIFGVNCPSPSWNNMNHHVHQKDQGGDYHPPLLRPTFRPEHLSSNPPFRGQQQLASFHGGVSIQNLHIFPTFQNVSKILVGIFFSGKDGQA